MVLGRDRLQIYIPILLLFGSVLLSITGKSGNDDRDQITPELRNNQLHDEIVITTPNPQVLKKDPLGNMLNNKSVENVYKVEKSLEGWSDIFESFTFNLNSKGREFLTSDALGSVTGLIAGGKNRPLGNVDAMVDQYGVLIVKECNFYKLDWRLILALIRQESYFNPEAVSHAGAYGFMQLMPATGASMQRELNIGDTKVPDNNIIAGIYYYATLVASFDFVGEDKYKFALAAYNGGFGRVVDAMTIAAYFDMDYNKWDDVKQMYPYLASNQDSVHALVWPEAKRPLYGALNNWIEPYNYVESVSYFYEEYKNLYETNLKEEKQTTKNKKNSKKKSR